MAAMAGIPLEPNSDNQTTSATPTLGETWRALLSSARDGVRGSSQDPSQRALEMQKRLADPQSRGQLREQRRTQIRVLRPDLAQALGLSPQTANELIDFLTDQEMRQLDRTWGAESQAENSILTRFARNAEEGTRRIEALRNLLGEEGFERYRDYNDTLRERLHVALFEERLQPSDKLAPDQRSRLMDLLRNQIAQSRREAFDSPDAVPPQPFSPANREAMERHNITRNEQLLRRARARSELLMGKLAEFLTQSQIAVYARMESENIDAQRKHVEQLRVNAGMSQEIPPSAGTEEPAEQKPIRGQIRLEVSISIDEGVPVLVSVPAENGTTVLFEGPRPLWVEATPVVFDDGRTTISFDFYEQGDGKRRKVGSLGLQQQSPSQSSPPLGTTRCGCTIHGSTVHAIWLDARVTLHPGGHPTQSE